MRALYLSHSAGGSIVSLFSTSLQTSKAGSISQVSFFFGNWNFVPTSVHLVDRGFEATGPKRELDTDNLRKEIGILHLRTSILSLASLRRMLRQMSPKSCRMSCEVEKLPKLLFIVPATSATPERSFIMPRIESWRPI